MENQPSNENHGVNVLALLKGKERYVFLYDDESQDAVLKELGKCAADPELSFSWYDAATLSQRVRKMIAETIDPSEPPVSKKKFPWEK